VDVIAPPAALPLDQLEPVFAEVGYSGLGRNGWLGYEGRSRRDRRRTAGLRARHYPPARLRYQVPGGFTRFRCSVALNDDVAGHGSSAGFTVVADGRIVADVPHVRAGSAAVPVSAEIGGATTLDLCVTTARWEHCRAVWLDPVIETAEDEGAPDDGGGWQRVITDPLARADLLVPRGMAPADRCVVTVASAGFEQWVDDLLGSVRRHGGCPDALLVVLALGDAPELDRVARSHGAAVVRCRPRAALDPNIKSVMHSAGRVIPAARFVCLDADMVVLDDLSALFAAIDALPPYGVLVGGEGNDHGTPHLAAALDTMYRGGADPPFFQRDGAIGRYPLVVNDGLLAGSRTALCALDAEIRALPGVIDWVDADPHVRWRNQFAANVALARMGSAVELDPSWNVRRRWSPAPVSPWARPGRPTGAPCG
jgi:hypothetical protein